MGVDDDERQARNLALAKFWREGGDRLSLRELESRVRDVERRLELGFRPVLRGGEYCAESSRWRACWRMHNVRLFEYGKLLIKELGGNY